MSQSRRASAAEATANIVAGVVLQYVIALTLLRAMGFNISHAESAVVTLVMTAASFARQYVLRRVFNGVAHAPR